MLQNSQEVSVLVDTTANHSLLKTGMIAQLIFCVCLWLLVFLRGKETDDWPTVPKFTSLLYVTMEHGAYTAIDLSLKLILGTLSKWYSSRVPSSLHWRCVTSRP